MTATTRRQSAHPPLSRRTPFRNDDFFDEAQLRSLREYARPVKRVRLAEKAVSYALEAWLIFGLDLGPRAAGWVGGQGWFVRLIVVIAVFAGVGTLVGLPFGWWRTMVWDQRHGLSNQGPGLWVADQVKDYVLGVVLVSLLLAPVYAAIHSLDSWWLVGGLAFVALQLLIAFVYPVLIMPRFNKFTPMPDGPVRRRIEEIAALADTSIEGVYTMDGSKRSRRGNAFVAGYGATKRIVVFDTVMDMPLEQLSQIVAHEIGHYRRKHIVQSFPLAAVMMLVAFAFVEVVSGAGTVLAWAGVDDIGDPAAAPIFLVAFTLPQSVMGLASSWLSRRHEREADLEALELLGDPTSFVAMWPYLVELNQADLEPGIWDRLNASHPEIGERMAFGLRWAEMNGVPAHPPPKAAVPAVQPVQTAG